MVIIDPSTGQPYTRPGTVFLYSESGAAAILRADADAGYPTLNTARRIADTTRPPYVLADQLGNPTRIPHTGPDGPYTLPLAGNTPIPTNRTPRHAAPYNQHAESYDRIWCTLFGPVHTHARHARRDR